MILNNDNKKSERKKIQYHVRNKKQKLGYVIQARNIINKTTKDDFELETNSNLDKIIDNFLYSEFNITDSNISTLRTTTSSFICDDLFQNGKLSTGILPTDFEHLKVIGKGYFGKVTKVKYNFDSQIYALKSIKKSKLKEQKHIEHIKNERRLLEQINHPFIVSMKFAFQTQTKLYIVMEFLNGGELFYHIRKRGKFSIKDGKFYFSQIVLAIDYLHSKEIIYRDLKPENLVLDNNGYIKLTDLGLAKECEDNSTTDTFCGTPEYLAPEIIRAEKYGKSVDIWCLGILLYEMLFGHPPFYDRNKEKLYKKIIFNEPDYSTTTSNDLTPEAKDLFEQLLQKNPKNRPKISEIKKHSFFKDFNFDDIMNLKIEPPFKPDKNNEFKFIDPDLNLEKPEDSLYNGLSFLNNKEFYEFTYSENFLLK